MSNYAIRAEQLGKRFRIDHKGHGSAAHETLEKIIRAPLAAFSGRGISRAERHDFWALKSIDLQIEHGNALGIIGQNGAGKSILLKILARITPPSCGYAEVYGRTGALLEVGTGFHPELTGRENVFLNGAILGMRKVEINKKFDEIVAFAEIEKFLDTPVKQYSSGMFVRLAFAIAAHLEPDVLIVDEVLAVGDAAFQRKCLGKMDKVAHEDRTILFVSHNLGAVSQLCTRCLLLKNGNILSDGAVDDVVQQYIAEATPSASSAEFEIPSDSRMGIKRVWISDSSGNAASEIDVLSGMTINAIVEVREPLKDTDVSVLVANARDTPVTSSNLSHSLHGEVSAFQPGDYHIQMEIPGNFLVPDLYKISIACNVRGSRNEHSLEQAISFTVVETGSNLAAHRDSWRLGCVLNNFPWSCNRIQPASSADETSATAKQARL